MHSVENKRIDQVVLSWLFSFLPENCWESFSGFQQKLEAGLNLTSKELWSSPSPLAPFKELYFSKIPALRNSVAQFQEDGIRFTFPGAWDYPKMLLGIPYSPVFLTYKGLPVWTQGYGVSVVGSRQPTLVTERWCEQELPSVLQQPELFSVSGGAHGVDQITHRISIREKRPTVALLPAGLRKIYPPDFVGWEASILENGGALVSEFSPELGMQKHHFDQRNRLISGLSLATIIIQARRKSGTLLTARHCVEQNRPLFVVPSHPSDVLYRGGLDLLSEGAQMVVDGQDLLIFLSAEISYSCQNFIRRDELSKSQAGRLQSLQLPLVGDAEDRPYI